MSRALDACMVSCIENHRYGGSDEDIRARLTEAGYGHLCDVPIARALVVRHLVRFRLAGVDARGVMAEVAGALGLKHGPVTGDRERAAITTLPGPHGLAAHAYSVARVSTAGASATAYRDPDPRAVWLLRAPPYRFTLQARDCMLGMGAGDVRWFSEAEWKQGAAGRALPF